MKLRCIVAPNPERSEIVVGCRYEVAEILELPGHAMVRKPNGKWPKPGEFYFGMHADMYFESSPNGIPAVSCGYSLEEPEFFGVVIPNSIFPTPRLGRILEPSAEWNRVTRIIKSVGNDLLWVTAFHGILTKICLPRDLERQFMLLGIDHDHIGRAISYRSAAIAIRQMMKKLRIPNASMPKVENQQLEFWRRSWRPAGPWRWKSPRVEQ